MHRHFSRALFLLSCTALVAIAQPPDPNKQSAGTSDSVFVERLQALSTRGGSQVVNCGFTGVNHPENSVAACGQSAFGQHRPFLLGYEYSADGETVQSGYGLAGDATGNVFAVNYHSRGFPPVALNRHMQLMDGNHSRITECIKPTTLNTTPRGLLACVASIDQEQSDMAARQKPVDTTVCAILANPPAFNNKMVRIRGRYSGNFEYSELSGDGCSGLLWFAYPGGGGPPNLAAYVSMSNMLGSKDAEGKRILPVPVVLVRDSKLERFEALVQTHTGRYGPLTDQRVTATFIGRIDAVSNEVHDYLKRQPSEKRFGLGFGQMGSFEAQFTLESVEDDAALQ
jgi:hypothetical protein